MEAMMASFPVRPAQPQPQQPAATSELDAYLAGFQAAAAALAKGAGPLLHAPLPPTSTAQTYPMPSPNPFDFQLASAAAAAAQSQHQHQQQQPQWQYPPQPMHHSPPQPAFLSPAADLDMFLANAAAAEPNDLTFLDAYNMEQELNLLTEHILDTSMCEGEDEVMGGLVEDQKDGPAVMSDPTPSIPKEEVTPAAQPVPTPQPEEATLSDLLTSPPAPTIPQTIPKPNPEPVSQAPSQVSNPTSVPLPARPTIPPRPTIKKPPAKKAKTGTKAASNASVPHIPPASTPATSQTSKPPTFSAAPATIPLSVQSVFQFGLPSPGSAANIPLMTATIPHLLPNTDFTLTHPKIALPRLTKSTNPAPQVTQQIIKHQRKVAHNAIERRYRNNINDRIAELRSVVPALNNPKIRDAKGSKRHREEESDSDEDGDAGGELMDGIPAATRLNKATILRKSTEYILYLKERVGRAEGENAVLRQ
ncbi:hypothetical protein HK097_001850, partial [Rhizophlyctis rosea]